jgi:glycosyltransferase involved in cell wall biosynthesis
MLATALKQNGINHLHAHFATTASTVARLAARFAQVPFSVTAHAKDIFHEDVDPEDFRLKLDEASATITVSDFNLQYLRKTYGESASRVHRVYNGMDLSLLNYSSPANRAPLIASVGRLVEKKGFADLIRACAILKDEGADFVCKIVGTGEEASSLRSLVNDVDVRDRVELLGPRPQRDVFDLIQQAAVFAAPCVVGADGNRDGLPTVLLESMALGTPCISTDVTGIPEVIQHNRTGLIVAQRNPAQLASAIRTMLADSCARQRLALAARQLIEHEFDVTHTSAQLRDLFVSAGTPAMEVA